MPLTTSAPSISLTSRFEPSSALLGLPTALRQQLEKAPGDIPTRLWENALAGPASEFLQRPGKFFRAQLVRLSYALAQPPEDCVKEPPAILPWIVELLHAGSLIVDDIEDGSVQRRGRATLHRLVGLPVALNTGNWMYFWALALLQELNLPPHLELALHRLTISAVQVCHEGQALDLTTRVGDLHPRDILILVQKISAWKTGSLLGLAGSLGATAAGAPEQLSEALRLFGVRLGMGLQMQNDLSELSGAAGPLKHPEDLLHGRVTWPWAWAAERLAPARFDALQVRAARLTAGTGDAAALARDLLEALGPEPLRAVRNWLKTAYTDLEKVIQSTWQHSHPALAKLLAELKRLETRYA